MDVRHAEASDGDAIGDVVRLSLQASYALSPQVIDGLVAEYSGDAVGERLAGDASADDGQVYLVAEADGQVVGFAEGQLADDGVGELIWLHVAPAGRGEGVGTALFEGLRGELEDRGATHVRAIVLADNQEGDEFFERFDLEKLAETDVERAGAGFSAHVFATDEAAIDDDTMTRRSGGGDAGPAAEAGTAPDDDVDAVGYAEAVEIPDATTDEGREVYVGGDDPIPGNEAPFFRTFLDEDRGEHYGYYCSNCGSTEIAMDELERLECADCGNVHRADEWDAAYL